MYVGIIAYPRAAPLGGTVHTSLGHAVTPLSHQLLSHQLLSQSHPPSLASGSWDGGEGAVEPRTQDPETGSGTPASWILGLSDALWVGGDVIGPYVIG